MTGLKLKRFQIRAALWPNLTDESTAEVDEVESPRRAEGKAEAVVATALFINRGSGRERDTEAIGSRDPFLQ